jgi:hypothetical protein
MKKLICAALALFASAAFAATTVPVQLLNPTGSTAGQTILSTGPTTAPAWGGIALSGLGAQAANTVVANATGSSATPTAVAMPSCSTTNSALKYTSGTGFSCGTTFATTGANTFTASQTVSIANANLTLSDAGGTGQARVNLWNNGVQTWGVVLNSSTNAFSINRYVSGTLIDNPISISNGTGTAAFTVRPTFNGATPWDSANLASPATTVGVTNGSNAAAGQVGEPMTAAGSAISLSSATAANCTSITLTAGDWDVWGYVSFAPGTGASFSAGLASLNTVSATQATAPDVSQLAFTGPANFGQSLNAPMRIYNVSSSTQIFLVGTWTFSGGTATMSCRMYARRRH